MKSMVGPHLKKREAERNQRDELTASTSHTIRFSTMIYILFPLTSRSTNYNTHFQFPRFWVSFSSFSKWVVWFSLAYRVVNFHLFCWMLYLDNTFCSIMVLVIVLWGPVGELVYLFWIHSGLVCFSWVCFTYLWVVHLNMLFCGTSSLFFMILFKNGAQAWVFRSQLKEGSSWYNELKRSWFSFAHLDPFLTCLS